MQKFLKVIHLYVISTDSHYYYGSLKALCDNHGKEEIGIVYSSLRAVGLNENKIYSNSKCIIRQGELVTTPRLTGAEYKE